MGTQPHETIASARRAWKRTVRCPDQKWLQNHTFISADCFKSPPPKTQLRAWDRIAVPAATASRSDQTIYKRIGAKTAVDHTYRAAVAELECQSFDARKRSRKEDHVVPYGSLHFKDEIRPDVTGRQDLNEARKYVETELQQIWRHNMRLRDAASRKKNKRPAFDPTQLTWIPRKRHNTRWPVNPPTEDCEFIAKLQPLIKFELSSSQIDEAMAFDPEYRGVHGGLEELHHQRGGVPQSPRVAEPHEPAQKLEKEKPSHRRRTLRPSLSTISEAADENHIIPSGTPKSTRVKFVSPAKEWQGPVDTVKTPTKVADSPMKDFTLSATPTVRKLDFTNHGKQANVLPSPAGLNGVTSHVPVFNHAGHFRVPSTSDTESTTTQTPIFSRGGHFRVPSSSNTESTTSHAPVFNHKGHFAAPLTTYTVSPAPSRAPSAARSDSIHTVAESSSTYVTALPFFDQPIAEVHVEPEHESRRRFSLDQARRSDRTSNVRFVKRVYNWMAGTSVERRNHNKRRHSDMGKVAGEQSKPKRRRTLDVDAGMNPDIFGQLSSLPIPAESPVKPVAIFHDAVELFQESVSNMSAVCAEDATVHPAKSLAQDEDCTTTESEEKVIPAQDASVATFQIEEKEIITEFQGMEEEVGESGEDEDNVEGDSDMAYLQNFVQRSKSSKEERCDDVPSAAILPTSVSENEKQSTESVSSRTSETGSPMARTATIQNMTTTTSPRVPLGEKDPNKSPSPNKKRKLKGLEQSESGPISRKKTGRLATPDLDDLEPTGNKRRKRRKGMESDTDDVFNPSMDTNQVLTQRSGAAGSAGGLGSRRSSRIATVQRSDPPPAIPVRLPGSIFTDNGDMPTVSTAGLTNAVLQRKIDKQLADETRANTQRNRGTAVPVHMTLASIAEGSDWDETTTTIMPVELKVDGKNVRWDQVLARVQGEEPVASAVEKEKAEEDDAQLPSSPQLRAVEPTPDRPGNPVGAQLGDDGDDDDDDDDDKPARTTTPVRRSSRAGPASRLPKLGGVAVASANAPAPTTPLAPIPTPKRRTSLLPAPARVKKSGVGAAEARVRLGMARPGTPGPRRGGRKKGLGQEGRSR